MTQKKTRMHETAPKDALAPAADPLPPPKRRGLSRDPFTAEAEPERETRGEKKRKAWQLENLGEALVKLPLGKLTALPMPDDLRAAVLEARRIWEKRAFGGYRRQIQFIGKIMRTVDARPIAAALEAFESEGTLSSEAFQQAERWRAKLIQDGDTALEELCAEVPNADRTSLRQLTRAAQVEVADDKNAKNVAKRALFRALRPLFEPAAPLADDDADDDGEDDSDD